MTPSQVSSMAIPLATSIIGSATYKNPADAAMPYLDQISGTITPYYQPFISAGTNDLAVLQKQLARLISDPAGFMAEMSQGFQASPGYEYNVEQATNAANQAAAAGGMVGSPAEQQALAQEVSGMANQDYYNYLNHVLGIYKGGMHGMGGITKLGYGASNQLANLLAQSLMEQAQLAYAGAANQNQSGVLGGLF